MPDFSRYERWVKALGRIIKIRVSPKDDFKIRKQLEAAHLNIEPSEVVGFAVMSFIIVFFLGVLASFAIWFINGGGIASFPIFFVFL